MNLYIKSNRLFIFYVISV